MRTYRGPGGTLLGPIRDRLAGRRSGPIIIAIAVAVVGLLVWVAVALSGGDSADDAGAEPGVEQPSGTPGQQGSGTTETPPAVASPGIPPFADPSEPLASGGTATLRLNGDGMDLDSWTLQPSGPLAATSTGLVGRDGLELGLLGVVPTPTFDTCRRHGDWAVSISWQDLGEGAFLCLRTPDGGRGLVRIDQMPEPDDAAIVRLTGVVWATRVPD